MSVVYAVQNVLTIGTSGSLVPRYDTSPALVYGELRYVFDKPKKFFGSPVEIAEEALRSMGPNDYLLLIGDPVLIGICVKIVADLFSGEVRILQWDRNSSKYEEYFIDFNS